MAKARRKNSTSAEHRRDPRWARITWSDVEDWAGDRSASRGRVYQRQRRVTDLAITPDHRLLATVMGSDAYSVSVRLQDEPAHGEPLLSSVCTCPVGASGCKHAVAVVAEYLDRLGRSETTPMADADDRRWAGLAREAARDDDWTSNVDSGQAPTDRRVAHGKARTSGPSFAPRVTRNWWI